VGEKEEIKGELIRDLDNLRDRGCTQDKLLPRVKS